MRKHMGVVKLCYNDQKAEKSGGGSNYVAMIFLVNKKKWENLWELSNYVGMIFLVICNTSHFPGVFGNLSSLWAYPYAHSGEAKYISIWLESRPGV